MEKTVVKFRVRNKGGKLAGKAIERAVPDFDWETFKNCPNAEEFSRKSYFQAVRRLVREVEEKNDQTFLANNLESIESVLTRSLKYTKDEIAEWIKTREWEQAALKGSRENALKMIEKRLAALSQGEVYLDKKLKDRLAEIIASVADKPSDAIADYLFSRLTVAGVEIDASDL